MTKEEIAQAIDAQSAENRVAETLPRDAVERMPVQTGFASIVTGVRRCGKSTLLAQWAERTRRSYLRVLFDDLRFVNFMTADFVLLGKIIAERQPSAIILDEVQDIEGWELFVNGLLTPGRQVLVTGSNAKMLSLDLGTKLTGRHLDLRMGPFTYSEFLRFTRQADSQEALRDYLVAGGFPSYLPMRNRLVLESLFNDIIYRDIVARYKLTNATPIRQLAAYLLQHIGTRLSPSRLKEAIHVASAKTVLDYFGYLTECCLLERLECFSESPKSRMLAQKKVYACDTGLVGVFERDPSGNVGHKLENLVYRVLRERGGDLTYFDSSAGECDFVRQSPLETEAVQVCWEVTDENREREIGGLVSALDRFGLSDGAIVTFSQKDETVVGGHIVRFVPFAEWCCA